LIAKTIPEEYVIRVLPFRALKEPSKRLLLAEWSLVATHSPAQPHVLAALTQAALECRKSNSVSNVRTVLGPKRLTELALAGGWQLESEACLQGGGVVDRIMGGFCLSLSHSKGKQRNKWGMRGNGV
tara:strand:- start:1118 stop:1498 length:381 start_codon:yes stop_codon:yes gene_type:complete